MNFILKPYRDEYQIYFERLNKAWLEEYFTVEPIDREVLERPDETILRSGGKILFVQHEQQIIGTVALKNLGDGSFELTKMAVQKEHQGIGAGKFLCKAAIAEARNLNASRIVLYSQTILKPAVRLYEQLGFKQIPLDAKYQRADIKMELTLN